jgi:three-Cys-motif partner protein
MAEKPKNTQWERSSRTEAKHRVLTEYLGAWIPILGLQRSVQHLVFIDGFAGPGRHVGGEMGSPLLMLESFARHRDRGRLGVVAHFFFIEKDEARQQQLQSEVDRRKAVSDIDVKVIQGDYAEQLPIVVAEARKQWPMCPIFAFIDPFGADTAPELTGELLSLPRCEALTFVPIGYLADFFAATDMQKTLRAVFGPEVFSRCGGLPAAARRSEMVKMMEERLTRSCQWVRAFELVPSGGGGRTHFLFFGTNSETGLARMKTAMWKLDPIGGVRFRDSTRPDQAVLFDSEPDLQPLWREISTEFAGRVFSIEEAEDFTLFHTPFLHDAHLKRQTLAPAERTGKLIPVDPPKDRRRNTYPKGTCLRIA